MRQWYDAPDFAMTELNTVLKLPLFSEDPDGTQRKQKHIMGRRNWCQVDWNPQNGELVFDLRIEKEKGVGTTVGYVVSSRLHACDRTHLSSLPYCSYATQVPAPNWPRS